MVRALTIQHIHQMVQKVGVQTFFADLINHLKQDYSVWDQYIKYPRHATHYDHGVIELMPISSQDYYAYKYVNGHPNNPQDDKQTVVAMGMLSEVKHGYPLLVSEMTLLTAFRTAATSALAAKYLARSDSKIIGIVGTGAQSEFQVLALHVALGVNQVKYYDLDERAMAKFANNLKGFDLELIPCSNAQEVVAGVDVITTATADKACAKILTGDMVHEGLHINGIGGDCPGKTELGPRVVANSKIVVEYYPQSKEEGEIQYHDEDVHAELWELVNGSKQGRENDQEITLFDSVGFALEDYTILRYVYQLAEQYSIGEKLDFIPTLDDPKDLFGLVR